MKKILVGTLLFLLVQSFGIGSVMAKSVASNHVVWKKSARTYRMELKRQEEKYPNIGDLTMISNFAASKNYLKHKKAVLYRLSRKHDYLIPVKKVSWLELATKKKVTIYHVAKINRPAIYYQINYNEGNKSHRYFIWRGYVSRPYRLIGINNSSSWAHWTIADSPKAP